MRHDSFSLKQLRAFFAVAIAESVRGACLAMNLSQPAVTQAVAKLEATLGIELFNRTRTGSYLTPYGCIFLERMQRFFTQLETALCDPDVGPPRIAMLKRRANSCAGRVTLIPALVR